MSTERCFAVVGTVATGPMFCGYPAKDYDGNGRPCCGRHRGKQEGIEWFGARYRYPSGTGGNWKFKNGEPREVES